jgi:hypothetical protein
VTRPNGLVTMERSIMTRSNRNSKTQCDHSDTTEPAMLTADQAHGMAGGDGVISRGAWYAALGRKEIPNVRVGRRILIPRHAFVAWLGGTEASGR